MLVVLVLLATVAIRVAIVLVVAYLLLSRGPFCPHCGAEMLPIRNRFFDWIVPALQRRWCVTCGWNGVVRRASGAPAREAPAPRAPRPSRR
jgi:hypothetical protein